MNLDSLLRRVAPLAMILAASSIAAGCGSTVEGADGDDSDGEGTGGSTSTGIGGGCDEEFVGDCSSGGTAVCVDGTWQCGYDASSSGSSSTGGGHDECNDGFNSCDPYPEVCDETGKVTGCGEPECPESNPGTGTPCSGEGLSCEVPSDVDCGPPTITITCVNGEWVDSVPRCLPLICRDLPNADQCEQNGCRWQEPGCGDNPLPQAGCFDIVDCEPGSCFGADETCLTVDVVPACATQEPACDSCAEQVQLCVPQFPDQGGEDDDGGDAG